MLTKILRMKFIVSFPCRYWLSDPSFRNLKHRIGSSVKLDTTMSVSPHPCTKSISLRFIYRILELQLLKPLNTGIHLGILLERVPERYRAHKIYFDKVMLLGLALKILEKSGRLPPQIYGKDEHLHLEMNDCKDHVVCAPISLSPRQISDLAACDTNLSIVATGLDLDFFSWLSLGLPGRLLECAGLRRSCAMACGLLSWLGRIHSEQEKSGCYGILSDFHRSYFWDETRRGFAIPSKPDSSSIGDAADYEGMKCEVLYYGLDRKSAMVSLLGRLSAARRCFVASLYPYISLISFVNTPQGFGYVMGRY
ncbi:uncharacterized protein BDR25DRAFT_353925 [Lindgomyces ingoldianus]|uniref:Uncharacterized protein n=1 Tax=Lindgomyces ingoldianus TaxID=673940 RepID=A0ACB6R071_9PLEO|nr:uncharacterized protein BDR25DRAFT_353925 [Lindgomyces ingoldianus]KAF2472223.1 hypothetical protein BDR25DRAFT_353925 [Lindgomyces ingoldianus]